MWTTTFVARSGRAFLAGAAIVVLAAPLAQADYGARTTIGNNYQQFSSTRSPDGINPGSCGGNICYILFQRAPQQRPLIIQHVACLARVSVGGLHYAILWNRQGQNFGLKLTYLLPVQTTGDSWVVNRPLMHLVESGDRATVRFTNSMTPNWSALSCTISGQLKQP